MDQSELPDLHIHIEPRDQPGWVAALSQALVERAPNLLELADRAVRAHPRDHQVLYLAAVARSWRRTRTDVCNT